MTFSIIARDEQTGHLGIAVASRFFAVGAVIPFITEYGAVATQALVNPVWGVQGNRMMQDGQTPQQALADLKARDSGADQRQVHMIDASGRTAAHTGNSCISWAGHICAKNVSVAGNMLEGQAVLDAMISNWSDNSGCPFAERLLAAMEAGEAAGGDKRGRQSACLKIHRGEAFAWLDLRADDHAQPLAEIRRLLDVAQERYIHFTDMMGSTANISGHADRSRIDAAIRQAELARRARGITSASHAADKAR